jgi:hypothetical protein
MINPRPESEGRMVRDLTGWKMGMLVGYRRVDEAAIMMDEGDGGWWSVQVVWI